jgi:hypothetical protein
MIPYVAQFLDKGDLATYEEICRVVKLLPEIDLGVDETGRKILLSCHLLARAIAKVFGLKYVDGFFIPAYMHTWILNEAGNLIDVYPVGMLGGPIMYSHEALNYNCPSHRLYRKKRLNLKTRRSSFRRALTAVTREIRKLHK